MALITTIAEFKKYIAIDANTKMATLQPYIDEAEQLYIKDLLGTAFYDEFLALYTASVDVVPVPLNADNAALLPYIQRALAYYTQLMAIPHLAVTFGDMGIRQHRGEDSDPAPRWLQEKLQMQALKNGDIHADKLLEFLEANATALKYNTWFASTANTKNSGYIVYGTAVASKHIDISSSRRVFLQLRNTIRELEKRSVPKLIGADQYDELKTQIETGSVTAASQALIDLIEPVVCKRALYMRLPFMRVAISADGLWLYSDVTELRSKDFLAQKEDIKSLRCELMDGEFGYLQDEEALRQFIIANIADYPLMADSPVYTVQPDPGPTFKPKNDPNNKHFIV